MIQAHAGRFRLRARLRVWLSLRAGSGTELLLGGAPGQTVGPSFCSVGLRGRQWARASGAIEGFNGALRPDLHVHKGTTPGFLSLLQAYYNLRKRRWGRRKTTSAYERLTGTLVDDWLATLGYSPSRVLHDRARALHGRPCATSTRTGQGRVRNRLDRCAIVKLGPLI